MSGGSNKKTRGQPAPIIDMSDLTAAWPTMSPVARRHAMRARIMGTDRGLFARLAKLLGLSRQPTPPAARRVAARALVLAAIVARAQLERPGEAGENRDQACAIPFATLKRLGIASELEPRERAFLKAPAGRADTAITAVASWRAEGLAVLGWALNRSPLPPYDEAVDARTMQDAIGFTQLETAGDLLTASTLRPAAEINRAATLLTLVTWRLRTFRMYRGPWDFVGHLRKQASFDESWLTDLRIVDGDLALGTQSIANAPAETVELCERSIVERQIAAYWLQGDDAVYSKVDPSTLLSAC